MEWNVSLRSHLHGQLRCTANAASYTPSTDTPSSDPSESGERDEGE